jgi:hypothetical protein
MVCETLPPGGLRISPLKKTLMVGLFGRKWNRKAAANTVPYDMRIVDENVDVKKYKYEL